MYYNYNLLYFLLSQRSKVNKRKVKKLHIAMITEWRLRIMPFSSPMSHRSILLLNLQMWVDSLVLITIAVPRCFSSVMPRFSKIVIFHKMFFLRSLPLCIFLWLSRALKLLLLTYFSSLKVWSVPMNSKLVLIGV